MSMFLRCSCVMYIVISDIPKPDPAGLIVCFLAAWPTAVRILQDSSVRSKVVRHNDAYAATARAIFVSYISTDLLAPRQASYTAWINPHYSGSVSIFRPAALVTLPALCHSVRVLWISVSVSAFAIYGFSALSRIKIHSKGLWHPLDCLVFRFWSFFVPAALTSSSSRARIVDQVIAALVPKTGLTGQMSAIGPLHWSIEGQYSWVAFQMWVSSSRVGWVVIWEGWGQVIEWENIEMLHQERRIVIRLFGDKVSDHRVLARRWCQLSGQITALTCTSLLG